MDLPFADDSVGDSLGNGGAEGSRTPDLLIANETLYQLSYDPAPALLFVEADWESSRRNAGGM